MPLEIKNFWIASGEVGMAKMDEYGK